MAKKVTVVISQGQSNNPAKRKLEEDLVTSLITEPGVELSIVPNLYDLSADSTGMLCLKNVQSDMILLSWLYPRAAHWILARNDIKGQIGKTRLDTDDEAEDEALEAEKAEAESSAPPETNGSKPLPNRFIFCLDLRSSNSVDTYMEEIRRIVTEMSVQTVSLMNWIGGNPKQEQLDRYLNGNQNNEKDANNESSNGNGANGNGQAGSLPIVSGEVTRIEEKTARRWYPVIDYSRCTNCMECLDFCLFGVYGVDKVDEILVEQPDNCKKGCPACSRVCPENAIIFPQHKTPAIAGSPMGEAGGLKIDLSKLFGAPQEDAMDIAVRERDAELMADGREAVGTSVGIPKRQTNASPEDRDELDDLMDQLDELEL